eukprot:GHVL01026920.1.p1 GENE.GHVL01026920.1~~GHVL01026920.1.p1  ORF type:complete len:558 (-),score=97.99 GHVL01026920.1:218-1846(-)
MSDSDEEHVPRQRRLCRGSSLSAIPDKVFFTHGKRSGSATNIRVVVRFKPMPNDADPAFFIENDQIISIDGTYTFKTDHVFDCDATQKNVYQIVAQPTVCDMLDGYNGTILAYGQTGSGKTWTMFGPTIWLADLQGIVPRTVHHIFEHVRQESMSSSEFVLKCSFLELYREELRDLLSTNVRAKLKIKESPKKGIYVDGLTEHCVASEEDAAELLYMGENMRSVGATRMNQLSSRSHVIFSITCHQTNADGEEKVGKLRLVDLAGSEKVNKSGAEGVTFEEAKTINLSLSALGNVISALADKRSHIPYRDSKLTRILQETLGGNYKTSLLVSLTPELTHFDESLSALNFSARAKAVCNVVRVNTVHSTQHLLGMIERLQNELVIVKSELSILRAIETDSAEVEDLHDMIRQFHSNGNCGTQIGISSRILARTQPSDSKGNLLLRSRSMGKPTLGGNLESPPLRTSFPKQEGDEESVKTSSPIRLRACDEESVKRSSPIRLRACDEESVKRSSPIRLRAMSLCSLTAGQMTPRGVTPKKGGYQ